MDQVELKAIRAVQLKRLSDYKHKYGWSKEALKRMKYFPASFIDKFWSKL